jgi:hypothetical protein
MSALATVYWIPLGAGGRSVAFNGRVFEALAAGLARRPRCALYHAALVAELDDERYTIELAPSPNAKEALRGVVATGAVGSRWLRDLRLFRYEVRCWQGGQIPDLDYAIKPARSLTRDPAVVQRLLSLARLVPTPVWGRDELGLGEMWNSNSVIAWLIASAALPIADLHPPVGGRAPGWDAGLEAARRTAPTRQPTARSPVALRRDRDGALR